jgi:hypothetical protein
VIKRDSIIRYEAMLRQRGMSVVVAKSTTDGSLLSYKHEIRAFSRRTPQVSAILVDLEEMRIERVSLRPGGISDYVLRFCGSVCVYI